MILRILFGLLIGVALECSYKHSILILISTSILGVVFTLNSASFDLIYGLWSILEITIGYFLSYYIRNFYGLFR